MAQSRLFVSSRTLVGYCCWLLLGIAGTLAPWILPGWLAIGAALLAILWSDRRNLPPPESLNAELFFESPPELHLPGVLHVILRTSHPLFPLLPQFEALAPNLRLIDFRILRRALTQTAPLRASFPAGSTWGGQECFYAAFETYPQRLGFETIYSIGVEYTSTLKLWIRRTAVPLPHTQYRVSPRLPAPSEERFKSMVARQRLLLTGSRQTMRSRDRDQFHSLRGYQYPDPIRDLDHKKSAKFGKPMVRVYESLHQHRLIIALDVGRTTLGTIAGSPKFEFFASSILSVARNALHARDSVGFVAFSGTLRCGIPYLRGFDGLLPLQKGDDSLQPREEETNYEILTRFVSQHAGGRSIILVFADVSRPATQRVMLEALKPLCRQHIVVALGISDRNLSVEAQLVENNGLTALSALSADAYWPFFFRCYLEQNFGSFQAHLGGIGGAALQIPHDIWMGTTARVYQTLRASLRA